MPELPKRYIIHAQVMTDNVKLWTKMMPIVGFFDDRSEYWSASFIFIA